MAYIKSKYEKLLFQERIGLCRKSIKKREEKNFTKRALWFGKGPVFLAVKESM
jgi:hypothetical protein